MDQVAKPDSGDARTAEEREAAYDAFVWKNLKRNYAGHFIFGMLGMTGFRVMYAPTFLPAYLFSLSHSATLVGLATAVQQVGQMLSPLFGASQIEHRTKILPVSQRIGTGVRTSILFIALTGWFVPTHYQFGVTLALLLALGVFNGMQRVVFQVLMGKVIPVSHRGRLQAWRNVMGGIIAAALAYFAGTWFLQSNVLGNGYATTFLLSFGLTTAGLIALSLLMREPEPPSVRVKRAIHERMRDLPPLFRADPAFLYFTIAMMLAIAGRAAAPFYILFAGHTLPLSGANIGLFSLAFLGADTVSNLVWGYAGDRFGFRVIFMASLAVWAAATLLLLNAHTVAEIFIAFGGLGAGQAGYQMASQTMVLEFGRRDEVAMRLALTSSAEGAILTIGPLVGGLVAASLGYPTLFIGSVLVLCAAIALLIWRVDEPRTRAARTPAAVGEG